MGPYLLRILVAVASTAPFKNLVRKVSNIPLEIEEVASMPGGSAACELDITRLNKLSASSPIRPYESMIKGRNS